MPEGDYFDTGNPLDATISSSAGAATRRMRREAGSGGLPGSLPPERPGTWPEVGSDGEILSVHYAVYWIDKYNDPSARYKRSG